MFIFSAGTGLLDVLWQNSALAPPWSLHLPPLGGTFSAATGAEKSLSAELLTS